MPAVPTLQAAAEAIYEDLLPQLPAFNVEVAEELGSTNAVLLERARSGDDSPALLVARRQTQGRGRQGRAWWSDPDASLTFSVALALQPRDWSGLSLAVAVLLADALEPRAPASSPTAIPRLPVRIGLKWPNDLWLRDAGQPDWRQGRKLAGILVETLTGREAQARTVVVGVGLNIGPATMADPSAAPTAPTASAASAVPAASFSTGYGHVGELVAGATPAGVLHSVAAPLVRGLLRFEQAGFDGFRDAFAARDLLRGTNVRAGDVAGTAAGVDGSGRLLVHTGSALVPIASGEVSVRPC